MQVNARITMEDVQAFKRDLEVQLGPLATLEEPLPNIVGNHYDWAFYNAKWGVHCDSSGRISVTAMPGSKLAHQLQAFGSTTNRCVCSWLTPGITHEYGAVARGPYRAAAYVRDFIAKVEAY